MKCNNENCPNKAVCFVVWVTQKKIYYCEDCFGKASLIMAAMGSPTLIPFPIESEVQKGEDML